MQHRNLWEALSRQADLPDEAFPGQMLLEVIENRRVLIEGHRGIVEYDPCRISVRVSYGTVEICGSCLQLQCMTKARLVISGTVDGIVLRRRNP